ncbi:MAG: hypothetical protein HJJLKODD_02910 [Phycisphaerae bacterium]|nr:hypothetical protein [Phycisphaerae bacterium]
MIAIQVTTHRNTGDCFRWPVGFIILTCTLIYGMTLAPTVTSEDSGELITAAS